MLCALTVNNERDQREDHSTQLEAQAEHEEDGVDLPFESPPLFLALLLVS